MVEPCATGGFKTRPSVGDQVSFTVRRIHADGTPTAGTVVQDAELERYLLGSNLQCRAIEVALETMREGECSVFLCNVFILHLFFNAHVFVSHRSRGTTLTLRRCFQRFFIGNRW